MKIDIQTFQISLKRGNIDFHEGDNPKRHRQKSHKRRMTAWLVYL